MPIFSARLYEVKGEEKFPEYSCPFNKSGPGTAKGTHLLFLSDPLNDRVKFGSALEVIGDPAIYGLLVYDGAISRNASLSHSYKGIITTVKSMSDIVIDLRNSYSCITGRTCDDVGKWEAILLDIGPGPAKDENLKEYHRLVSDLSLKIW